MLTSLQRMIPLALAAGLLSTSVSRGEMSGFYVGIDTRATLTGVYAGQANPNQNRLTFLYAHPSADPLGNHYHGIGTYSLIGPAGSPTSVPTNSGWRIPEVHTGQAPLTLVPATSGLFAGKLVSEQTAEHYSTIRLRPVHAMLTNLVAGPGGATTTNWYGYGSAEYHMFYSSGGTRTQSMAGAIIALELISLTPGLHIGDSTTLDLATNPGDRVVLGGGSSFDFRPVFWTETNAPAGTYEIKFKLVDTTSTWLESGIVTIQFRVTEAPVVTIAHFVHVSMPLVTEGHVLESAHAVTGPWSPVTSVPEEDHTGSGESAAQTGTKTLKVPVAGSGHRFFRLRKL